MQVKKMLVEELYSTLSTKKIKSLFREGLETGNDRLAITAMEELIIRCAPELIVETLDTLSPLVFTVYGDKVPMLGRSLMDCPVNVDPLLPLYGKALLTGQLLGPTEWVKKNAEKFMSCPGGPDPKKANLWAQSWLLVGGNR